MKTLLLIIMSIALSSCAVKINPDGSKDVTVDAEAAIRFTDAYLKAKYPVKEEK